MHKKDFLKHLNGALNKLAEQITDLPDNAKVTRITVVDQSGMVRPAPDYNGPVPASGPNRDRVYEERLSVHANVKMVLSVSTDRKGIAR